MPSSATIARPSASPPAGEGLWIRSRKFDLIFLTASGALVFLPYLSYGALQRLGASTTTAALIVGLGVTLLVGGPHMYSTYLRTALEPRFRERHGWLAYAPLVVIPALVIIGSYYAFLFLLTAFFFWASVHVTHQAQWISENYRLKVSPRVSTLDRFLDGAVILGALYTVAMYKFVTGRFTMGSSTLLFPDFLKRLWVAQAFTVGFAVLFLYYVLRTVGEIRRGEASWPRLLFMASTVALAFIIPLFDNLDVAFQGFNTWHSLQYLALTWYILTRQADRGEIGSGFVKRLSGVSKTRTFYAAMVGATLVSGGVYLFLWKGLGMPQDRSYYVVVLSFLLCHYFYDHFLFRDFAPLQEKATASGPARF
jgi:TRAP-type C4-dicarboxylate transport system permease small subunit